MALKISILHSGEPLTKSNSYFFRRRSVWIPAHIAEYEAALKNTAAATMSALGLQPLSGPISITITYYLGSKRRKDLPNLPKTTCDALNGIVYKDDNQIVHQIMYKYLDDKHPRVEIEVVAAEDPGSNKWPLSSEKAETETVKKAVRNKRVKKPKAVK